MKTPKVNPRSVLREFASQAAMARSLGLSRQAVQKMIHLWDTERRPMPERHHVRVARLIPERFGHLIAP